MKVVFHRGGNDHRTVERAAELGIRTVEADVMLCVAEGLNDGALCVHPGRLPRRTPEGHLAYDRAEARRVVERACGTTPPTLESLLAAIAARDMVVLLESKVAGTVAAVARTLEPHAARITVISFVGSELDAAVQYGLRTGCLLKHDPSPVAWRSLHRAYGFGVYAPEHWYVSRHSIDLAHEAGVLVVPWDVDESEEARRLSRLGADAVITDAPEEMLARGGCVAG